MQDTKADDLTDIVYFHSHIRIMHDEELTVIVG